MLFKIRQCIEVPGSERDDGAFFYQRGFKNGDLVAMFEAVIDEQTSIVASLHSVGTLTVFYSKNAEGKYLILNDPAWTPTLLSNSPSTYLKIKKLEQIARRSFMDVHFRNDLVLRVSIIENGVKYHHALFGEFEGKPLRSIREAYEYLNDQSTREKLDAILMNEPATENAGVFGILKKILLLTGRWF